MTSSYLDRPTRTEAQVLEDRAERELQHLCQDFVDREVLLCLSSLVSTLAEDNERSRGSTGGIWTLTEQAAELAAPIPDYEEAAVQEGWVQSDADTIYHHSQSDETYESWQECCNAERIDPYDREVYEHWAITSYLADKLEAKGEKVDRDFAGLTVWARTTTGQAISMDGVIREIVEEMQK